MDYRDPRNVRFREEYQGNYFFTKDEKEEFEIINTKSYGDVDIQFLNSSLIKNTKVGNIKAGLANTFNNSAGYRGTHYSPVCFDTFQYQYNNCIYPTNEGYTIRILNYVGDSEVYYKFLKLILWRLWCG